jgi:hypothetical protein
MRHDSRRWLLLVPTSLLFCACQSAASDDDMSAGPDMLAGVDMRSARDLEVANRDLAQRDFESQPAYDLLPPPDLTQGTCMDAIQNGMETDVDCGGPFCPECGDGAMCGVDLDCVDKVCANGVCAKATCMDHARNGDETDVDCGGLVCPACADKSMCKVDGDCREHICQAGVCVGATCENGIEDGDETDVDCGGSCAGCGDGKGCNVSTDCAGGEVCFNGTCST